MTTPVATRPPRPQPRAPAEFDQAHRDWLIAQGVLRPRSEGGATPEPAERAAPVLAMLPGERARAERLALERLARDRSDPAGAQRRMADEDRRLRSQGEDP